MLGRLAACGWMAALTICLCLVDAGAPRAEGQEPDDVLTGTDDTTPPTKKRKLLAWLKAGNYLDYTAEPDVHPSGGPHGGNVRTYYNSILVEDLAAGRTEWSKGAAMVKELYFSGTETVVGYAVMVKTKVRSGNGGKGWIFYENLDAAQNSAFYGRGLGLCANCHSGGTDFLLSPFRP